MLLTLLQFFATKFLFLALHLESGCFPRPLTAREEAIGLMKAVDTFDATRKARFSTYASRCIENAILSPAHFGMEKRIHLFHAMTHLRQNGFFGAERAVPLFALSYMAFRKTRSRSSNIAFHAGCPENTACST